MCRYDISIEFSRMYFRRMEEHHNDAVEGGSEEASEMSLAMAKLRKNLITLNNEYLKKRRVLVDKGFKVLPHLVDEKLEPKKKQPAWLQKEGLLLANLMEPQGKEWYFR